MNRWHPSRFQVTYFMWLIIMLGWKMLKSMRSEDDYTRMKDQLLRSCKKYGMEVDMKSESAMATDIVKWAADAARPSLPRSKNDVRVR